MVAPSYAVARSNLAKQTGLGQQRKKPVVVAPPVKPRGRSKKTQPDLRPTPGVHAWVARPHLLAVLTIATMEATKDTTPRATKAAVAESRSAAAAG
jgi:hypothetical protein